VAHSRFEENPCRSPPVSLPQFFFSVQVASAQIVFFEADTEFPEELGWERITYCTPERGIEDGAFWQEVQIGECERPPNGDRDAYRKFVSDMIGLDPFFFEWRVETDGDQSEIVGVAPVVFAAGSFGSVQYHFTISRDLVRFNRDIFEPLLFFDIDPDVPHTYRVELYGDETYIVFIDGVVVDSGVPAGSYPSAVPQVVWQLRSHFLDSTAQWDYIRFGQMPADGSVDFDSNGSVELFDFRYFAECRSNSGPGVDAGPGCRWADTDADTDVDAQDFAQFQQRIAEVSGG
jgi:hypothetical protein